MVELLYPVEGQVPVYPAPTAADIGAGNPSEAPEEWFPVVEPSGEVIGMARRKYCHGGSKLLHPVVHLHVLDRMGRLYLQQRSERKDLLPGCWDTAVGGHVSYGEQIGEALFRESGEELGFTEYNPIGICSYVFESGTERELVNVFAAVGSSFSLTPDPSELKGGRFWTFDEIDEAMGTGLLTPNFEGEFRMIRLTLLSLL